MKWNYRLRYFTFLPPPSFVFLHALIFWRMLLFVLLSCLPEGDGVDGFVTSPVTSFFLFPLLIFSFFSFSIFPLCVVLFVL